MILLALGSNMGERETFLSQARLALEAFDIAVIDASSIYETPALMPQDAPAEWNMPYLNQVLSIETHHPPHDLLACIQHIEAELGRAPAARWAPREIDIDMLAYHETVMVSEHLVLPHPQMDQRRFVLEPLAEIAPQWPHPILGKTAQAMLDELP